MEKLTKKELKAMMIMDNEILKTAYNKKNMTKVLSEIPDFDFKKFNMSFDQFKIDEKPDENTIPEPPKVAKAKLGDVYQLGNHRLMCGDSTNETHIRKLLGDKEPSLVFTDPPYDMEEYDYLTPLFESQKDIEVLILNGDKGTVQLLDRYSKYFVGFYIITFNSPVRFSNQPMISHRLITHYRKGKSKFRNLRDAFGTVQEIVLFKSGLTRHEKPLELSKKFIVHYSKEDDIILDLFGSSGSTLISSEYLGRTCLMMEIEPPLIDLIIERWENLTKSKAVLIPSS
jgi:site-specific DNA-methyltransferase (adenine-specific)